MFLVLRPAATARKRHTSPLERARCVARSSHTSCDQRSLDSSVFRSLLSPYVRQRQVHVEALLAIGWMLLSSRLFRHLCADVVDQLAGGDYPISGVVVRRATEPEENRMGEHSVR